MTRKEWWTLFKWGAAILFLLFALSALAYGLGWFGEAGEVVQDEFGAGAALEKYEWFVDQDNHIKDADANVELFQQKADGVEEHYVDLYGEDKSEWSTVEQAQYSSAVEESTVDLVSALSIRNGLVADYNAQSEKFNWAPFESRDDMPRKLHDLDQ